MKNKNKVGLFLLLTMFMSVAILGTLPSVVGDYSVSQNDIIGIEWVQDDIFANTVGKQMKIEVTDVNSSNAGGMWANTTFASQWVRANNQTSWTLALQEKVFSVYNVTPTNYLMTGGYGGFGIGASYLATVQQSGFVIGANNLTAVQKYFNKSWCEDTAAPFNVSKLTGLNLTLWNGTATGIGAGDGAFKMVMLFNATNNVSTICKIYTWSTSNSEWQLKLETKPLYDFGVYTSSSPPIPGFELIFILVALSSIMGLFLWKKIRINPQQN
ncbi:MAG: hypothetical protein EAX96_20700 [Candidatus Lokiarchaeota archaeon]|nr:hypothetical protein [Candidatus Lokiarchaeota archaeon]